jgi:hypothetical protein
MDTVRTITNKYGVIGLLTAILISLVYIATTQFEPWPIDGGVNFLPTEQPASSVIPAASVRMPFTAFTLANNKQKPVIISGVKVQVSKLSDPAGIKEVELVDENGMQVGPAVPLDANNEATIGSGYMLWPMSSSTLVVAANISGCEHACKDNGESVNISVTGIDATTTFINAPPITGATHVMNSPIKIGTVIAEPVGESGVANLPNDRDMKFLSTRFTAGPQEDLVLYSVRYKYKGTLDFERLSNVQATMGDRNYPALTTTDGEYVTVAIQGGMHLTEGSSLTVTLHGSANTTGEQGKTVAFDIEDPADAYFVGQTYGYGVGPQSGAWMTGKTFHTSP